MGGRDDDWAPPSTFCLQGVAEGKDLGETGYEESPSEFRWEETSYSGVWVDWASKLVYLTMLKNPANMFNVTVARVSQALGMEIIVYTSRPRLTASSRRDTSWYQPGMGDPEGIIPSTWFHGTSKKDLQNFLSQGADVVVLSLPLTEHTKHIIGEQELQTMTSKSPAFLINISRGPIIDQAALLESLKRGASNGGLQGAALDVTDPEPLPAENELWSLPNVFISPHVSSISPGTTGRAFRILEENMTRRLEGRELVNVVKATDRKSSI